jgi:hypothetical protein
MLLKLEVVKNILLIIGSLAIALILAEVIARALVTAPPQTSVISTGRERVRQPLPGIRYLYNARSPHTEAWPSDPSEYFDQPGNKLTYLTNNYGFRDKDFALKLGKAYRIAILGDSFCWGSGVRRKDRFSDTLEHQLNNIKFLGLNFEVFNFCLPGFNTQNEASLNEYVIDKFSPDFLIVSFFLNDINLPPKLFVFPKGILQENKKPAWINKSKLLNLVVTLLDKIKVEKEFIKHTQNVYHSSHPAYQTMDDELDRIAVLSQKHNRNKLMVIFPWLFKLNDNEYPFKKAHTLVARSASTKGFQVVDLFDHYKGMKKEQLWVHDIDHHPNAFAHNIAAEVMVEKVREMLNKNKLLATTMVENRRQQHLDTSLLKARNDWYIPFFELLQK